MQEKPKTGRTTRAAATPRGLRLIAAFKLLKGLALFAVGIGAAKLLHKDIAFGGRTLGRYVPCRSATIRSTTWTLLGLSPNDVLNLINAARNATNDMTLNGDRIPGGALNNFISTFQRVNPFRKNKVLMGCGDQPDFLIRRLIPVTLNTRAQNWTLDKQYEYLSLHQILPHQWVEYTSGDSNDPRL